MNYSRLSQIAWLRKFVDARLTRGGESGVNEGLGSYVAKSSARVVGLSTKKQSLNWTSQYKDFCIGNPTGAARTGARATGLFLRNYSGFVILLPTVG